MATEADQLIRTHPGPFPIDENTLIDVIDRIYGCGKTCTACADACLGEDDPKAQAACITSCQNCGEVCITTARALSRVTGFNPETIRHLVEACEQICRICADECASHGDGMEHCRRCSETCRDCADACRSFLQELQAA
ncbi:MAG: four-helix bundle copper-binding protein [Actinobacteria bacterium]|nr:four-helix bundle copper-binding protein [Actinomycetota bacterium]